MCVRYVIKLIVFVMLEELLGFEKYVVLTAVYISDARRANGGSLSKEIDTDLLPKGSGITYELCAGILDKEDATVEEVAKMEILEETGYDVPLENIESITVSRYAPLYILHFQNKC